MREKGLWKLADMGQLSLSHRHQAACLSHLVHLSGFLRVQQTSGKLERLPGAAFLLQLTPKVKDEHLAIFVCPGDRAAPAPESADVIARYRDDWRSAPCSYR